ncbi:ATP-dependent Clp protease ATP-binding subunit ClpX [Mobilisporobacter senegalensis]|uniref:ATP-dependent Clp protease ATP-binding subunit ClpX n=1 Tax=Mobilisporobacter senegalensis TaxID=1329262 RepID=A0A3N1Y376_9FIRM|nr:ATP-dependent Clp protease ATP-binding subunit ClpX [Mobilisporobacter senegalensis]ROR31727.1 ATP-dependent Clp protease ATP-binding subunit ClpX [Mobilisporobacter senegalensis]
MLEKKCCICNDVLKINEYIVINNGKCICNSCMNNIACINKEINHNPVLFINASENKKESNTYIEKTKPVEIKVQLDQYIIGQEAAKKILAVATYNHLKRCEMNDAEIKKSNILLIGPTGSGKTYLVQMLAKILNVPFVIIQATSLTEAGYIGDDVEICVQRLLENAGGDVALAERGIIFIDEIDKLTATSSETKKQVGGKGVQQALLSLLDGIKVHVPSDTFSGKGKASMIEVDTTNILFICGGAFPEAESIIKKRLMGKNPVGFSSNLNPLGSVREDNLLLKVNNDDLKEFGLIPELLGRLPIIAPLEGVTIESLKRILTEPRNSIVSQYQRLFDYDSIKLNFEEEALEEIAVKAFSKGTGARSLRGILEELLLNLMYESPSKMDLNEIFITKEYVHGEADHAS